MSRIVTGALIVACVVLLAGVTGADTLFGPTQDPLAGSHVFGAKGCVKCHSVNGVGGKVGPDLAQIARPRTFYDLAAALWNHAPRMADKMRQLRIARPQLDARETGDLVAFLYTLDYFDRPGRPDVGHRLFTEKHCVMCHQVGGTGGVIGPNLDLLKQSDTPIFLATAMWNHAPRMAEVMKARGIPRPGFKDSELADLIAYVNSASAGPRQGPLVVLPGRPEQGRQLFVEKRCAECHSVGGQGGKIGPDLAERGAHKTLTQFAAAMWNKMPAMTDAMHKRGVPVPELQPTEMADIVAYLYSVRYFAQAGDPHNGVKLAASKGCLGCHALYGERGKVASDLAKAKGLDSPAAAMAALWNHSFISDPRPVAQRTPFPELRADEMADLMSYLQSLRGRK